MLLNVPGAFRFEPQVVPPAVVAAGRTLRFGPGEAIPQEVPGILLHGFVQEDVLDQEFDLKDVLAALGEHPGEQPGGLRLAASAQAEIARQAVPFIGPLAATLIAHVAEVTEDPFVVYHAIALRIPTAEGRARFLSGAPA